MSATARKVPLEFFNILLDVLVKMSKREFSVKEIGLLPCTGFVKFQNFSETQELNLKCQ